MSAPRSTLSLLDVVLCGGGALLLLLIPILDWISEDHPRRQGCMVTIVPTGSGAQRFHWDLTIPGRNGGIVPVPSRKITSGSGRMVFCLPAEREHEQLTLQFLVEPLPGQGSIPERARLVLTSSDRDGLKLNSAQRAYIILTRRFAELQLRKGLANNHLENADFQKIMKDFRQSHVFSQHPGFDSTHWSPELDLYLNYRCLLMLRSLGLGSIPVPWAEQTTVDAGIKSLIGIAGHDANVEAVRQMLRREEQFRVPSAAIVPQSEQFAADGTSSNPQQIDPTEVASRRGFRRSDEYWKVCAEFHRQRVILEHTGVDAGKLNTSVPLGALNAATSRSVADPVLQWVCLELRELYSVNISFEVTCYWGGQHTTSQILASLDTTGTYTQLARIDLPDASKPPRIVPLLSSPSTTSITK